MKMIYNQSSCKMEEAKQVTCPRCSGFGGCFGDEDGCPMCKGHGKVWLTEGSWLLPLWGRGGSDGRLY